MKLRGLFIGMPLWLRLPLVWAACIAVFVALLLALALIPVDAVRPQIVESADILSEEGLYPKGRAGDVASRVDNFTSAIMLGIAGYRSDSALETALLARRPIDPDPLDPVASLTKWADSGFDSDAEMRPYTRYWHGYLVLLKPLLVFLNVNQIRQVALVACCGLALVLAARLARVSAGGGSLLVALCVALPPFCLGMASACQSLSFAPSFLVALAASVALTFRRRSRADGVCPLGGAPGLAAFFLVVGSVTNYLDFLCNPVLTLGLPLLTLLACSPRGLRVRDALATCLVASVAWGAGYGLTWAAKWVLTAWLTGYDAIGDALAQAGVRVGTGGGEVAGEISRLDALTRNLALAFPTWSRKVAILCVAAALVTLAALTRVRVAGRRDASCEGVAGHAAGAVGAADGRRGAHAAPSSARFRGVGGIIRGRSGSLVGCLYVAALPVAWVLAFAQHSYVHYWFVYRYFILFLAAAALAFALPLHDASVEIAATKKHCFNFMK